jgi:Putative Ig domain
LDLERKLKTRSATDTSPLRPSILDFLANYRDLQELGSKSPTDLYEIIKSKRINSQPLAVIPVELCNGTVNTDYPPTTLKATGGKPPLKWSVTPALPLGIALDPATGKISGKPTVSVSRTIFVFTVTDSASPAAIATADAALEVK